MKKTSILFIFTFFIANTYNLIGQAPNVNWQKCFGGYLNDHCNEIIKVSDGNFLFIGNTDSHNADVATNIGMHVWVSKIDGAGHILWNKFYGSNFSNQEGYSVLETRDFGFLFCAETGANGGDVTGHHGINFSADFWLVKTDSLGNIQWQKCIGGSESDIPSQVKQTNDGGYIVVGKTSSSDGDVDTAFGYTDGFVVKVDSVGTIQWSKSLGGGGDDYGNSVQPTSDGGFLVGCTLYTAVSPYPCSHGLYEIVIYKLDSLGNLVWEHCYGGSGNDQISKIVETSDGNFLVGASTSSPDGDVSEPPYYHDMWVFKIDGTGTILWDHCYDGLAQTDEITLDLKETIDHGFILCGISYDNCNIAEDFFFLKADSMGVESWRKCLGGSDIDFANSMIEVCDSSYLVAGTTQSLDGDITYNHSLRDVWLVSLGYSTSSIVEIDSPASNISCYQEGNKIFLNFNAKSKDEIIISLHDLLGQIIFSHAIKASVGSNQFSFELNSPSGIKILRLQNANSNTTVKVFTN